MTDTTTITMWVPHSPYSDHTWRGLEKCPCPPGMDVGLFYEKEDCEAFIAKTNLQAVLVPVPVTLTTPRIRGDLSQCLEGVTPPCQH